MNGQISINRTRCSHEDDYVSIEVVDKSSRNRFLKIKLDMETFANVITGLSHQDCDFELVRPDLVGMIKEHKSVFMPHPVWGDGDDKIDELFAEFEIDGWIGSRSDIKNHHKQSNGKATVGFHRFVKGDNE